MSKEDLTLELSKRKTALRDFSIEKIKSGKAKEYRIARKEVARIMTALNAQKGGK